MYEIMNRNSLIGAGARNHNNNNHNSITTGILPHRRGLPFNKNSTGENYNNSNNNNNTDLFSRNRTSVSAASSDESDCAMISDKETCNGSLSSSDFRIAANAFAENWNKFNSGFPAWLWIDCSNRLGFVAHGVSDGYLSINNVLFQRPLKEEHDECSFNDHEESSDNATLVHITDDDGNRYDFHVVYSPSYRVPVLYFRAHSSDGQPLNLDQIEKNLPTKSAEVLIETKWTFITQEEHPYLNRPWYTLHPCGTSEWMKLLGASYNSSTKGRIEQYLVSWFSVVGQVFGLKLPFEMLKSIS